MPFARPNLRRSGAQLLDLQPQLGWGGVGWAAMKSLNLHTFTRGVGVGGVGCNDIVELARMFDATSHVGLVWVGWGVMTPLNLHACLVLHFEVARTCLMHTC